MRHGPATRLIAQWSPQLPKRYEVEHQSKLVAACAQLLMLKPWPMRELHEL
jgi:hypothetical protein